MALTPSQSRAARGLLDWSQTRLAEASNLSESTIRDFEKGRRVPTTNNLAAVIAAFERAGLELIEPDEKGEGVRFKTPEGQS